MAIKFCTTKRFNFGLVVLIYWLIMYPFGGLAEVTKQLDPRVQVTWNVLNETSEIIFKVVAETRGYVGFGLSTNGAMTNADIVIGGVAHGKPYFEVSFFKLKKQFTNTLKY